MESDYEYDDEACPRCGQCPTHRRPCYAIGCEDGYIDRFDEDPINLSPGEEMELCHECHGFEVLRWCPKCGLDLNGKEARKLRKVKGKV